MNIGPWNARCERGVCLNGPPLKIFDDPSLLPIAKLAKLFAVGPSTSPPLMPIPWSLLTSRKS